MTPWHVFRGQESPYSDTRLVLSVWKHLSRCRRCYAAYYWVFRNTRSLTLVLWILVSNSCVSKHSNHLSRCYAAWKLVSRNTGDLRRPNTQFGWCTPWLHDVKHPNWVFWCTKREAAGFPLNLVFLNIRFLQWVQHIIQFFIHVQWV